MCRKNYQGIIFDLDGVICHTDRYHFLGINFDDRINDRMRGVSRMDSLEILLEEYHGEPLTAAQKVALAEKKNQLYVGLLQNMGEADLSEEVRKTMDTLRSRGRKLAIGSSSKNTKLILKRLGLTGYFDAVSDGTNITRSKPDPEVFLCAAQYLGLCPGKCLVVEDAKAGILAAKAGGFDSAGLGEAAAFAFVTYPLQSFSDLLKLDGNR